MSATDLNARYGRTASRRRRTIVGAIVLASVILVTFGAWAIWVGLFQPSAAVEYVSVGQTRVSSNQLKVTWELSVDTGTPTKCAIQALDANFGIVGWKIVSIPASATRSRTLSSIVRTAQPAVSGLIYQCWLS
ncbi:MAG TPA: DUF4307 domain-containing protein [Galbitalea sp.]|nr:DUF4307 domain-containing protein [Galbitalea sp.]